MKISLLFLALFIFIVCLIPQSSQACTAFCIDKGGQIVGGFNFDWIADELLLVINKRNVSKTALHIPEADDCRPVSWTSKYGSVTYTPTGREFPLGGMNETGLVVLALLLPQTQYPTPDSRPCIASFQWIQYQLDNFSKVEQVIASMDSTIKCNIH
jgi:choloylglycine hydrolase